ncbi:hypothetical protein OSTOST_08987 [Ostertagia ostertagi]
MNRSMQEEFTELTSLNSTSGFSRSDETTRHRPPISAPFPKPISASDVTNTSVPITAGEQPDTILGDDGRASRRSTDFSLFFASTTLSMIHGVGYQKRRPPTNQSTARGTAEWGVTRHPLSIESSGKFLSTFPPNYDMHGLGADASSSSTPSPNSIRLMTAEEMQRWHEKETREHKKAQSHLSGGRRREPLPDGPRVDDEKSFRSEPNCTYSTNLQPVALTKRAGNFVRKVLQPAAAAKADNRHREQAGTVRCRVRRPVHPRVKKTRESSVESSQTTEDVTSYSPQKRVHLIETKLLTTQHRGDRLPPGLPPKFDQKPPPGRPPKTRNIPVVMNGRSMNYDNLNGVGAGRVPPPVPPKPRMTTSRPSSISPPPPTSATRPPLEKDSPGFAPSITRGSLFSSSKKEEIIKF